MEMRKKVNHGYRVFNVVSTILIGLFALFWALQTGERWADGISPAPAPDRPSQPPPEASREPETVRV